MTNSDFRRQVARRARRMQTARSAGERFWAGLALTGSVGWMIALPMVAGVFLGRRLDARLGTGLAFTLGLMLAGLAAGAYGVWRLFLRSSS